MFSRISNLFSIEISRILDTAFFICVRNTQLHPQSYTQLGVRGEQNICQF